MFLPWIFSFRLSVGLVVTRCLGEMLKPDTVLQHDDNTRPLKLIRLETDLLEASGSLGLVFRGETLEKQRQLLFARVN